jgi:hypothetical protein
VPDRFVKQLFTAAWLSVIVAIAIELLLIILAAVFRKYGGPAPFIADFVQKLAWSTLVCVGLAVGLAAGKLRPQVMGLLGLLAAPLAFTAAKALHKSAEKALELTSAAAPPGPTPLQFVILRAVEYACLGIILGWVSRKTWGTLRTHAAIGLAMGLMFGGMVILLTLNNAKTSPTAYQLGARAVNEIIFPIGCSMVIYAANVLGRRARGEAAGDAAPSSGT